MFKGECVILIRVRGKKFPAEIPDVSQRELTGIDARDCPLTLLQETSRLSAPQKKIFLPNSSYDNAYLN